MDACLPGVVEPRSAISGALMSHLRYPQDLFKVQRSMLGRYHVTDPASFFGGQDFWKVPSDPAQRATVETPSQPPYYLSVQVPGQSAPTYSLTSTFTPENRTVLSAFLSADADAGDQPGRPREGYGTLRLLELPKDAQVQGPQQVANEISSSAASSPRFALTLGQFLNSGSSGGSKVAKGNLLTLPVGGECSTCSRSTCRRRPAPRPTRSPRPSSRASETSSPGPTPSTERWTVSSAGAPGRQPPRG